MPDKIKRLLLGEPQDVTNPSTYHRIALIAVLAWVGLGADGLSSSAYGPDEAFRALGEHRYLAIALAIATAITVFTISTAYRNIIELFPFGGGGYIVAGKLLGPRFGVVSGSALLVDYVLTVSVSIAACADQLFSVLPHEWHIYKLIVESLIIGFLILLNLRGVKESILILAPIFFIFLVLHAVLLVGGIGSHLFEIPRVASEVQTGFRSGIASVGLLGVMAVFFKAFSMGAGTYTGIEAVSNGLQIMREPKVETGKRVMLYMAISLAVTAAGILICYLLFDTSPVTGKTMNAVLLDRFASSWQINGINVGHWFVVITLASEAALLYVAAQAGFIDGPRVMANMALDGWFPRRFSQLSDRLTMQYGILLMGISALLVLYYTRGDITALVTMYSINVFLTFSLSETGMVRHWFNERKNNPKWYKLFTIHSFALVVCLSILITVIVEKFSQCAWMTLIITSVLVTLCFLIFKHYKNVSENIRRLDKILDSLSRREKQTEIPVDPKLSTAVMMVSGFGGLSVYQLLQVQRLFPGQFKNYLIVSVGIIDSAAMKGVEEVERTKQRTEESLKKYVAITRRLGYPADYRMSIGTEAIEEAAKLCQEIHKEFPNSIFFMGKLIFKRELWYHRLLHNETAYQLQHRLHFAGLDAIVLSVHLDDAIRINGEGVLHA